MSYKPTIESKEVGVDAATLNFVTNNFNNLKDTIEIMKSDISYVRTHTNPVKTVPFSKFSIKNDIESLESDLKILQELIVSNREEKLIDSFQMSIEQKLLRIAPLDLIQEQRVSVKDITNHFHQIYLTYKNNK